MDLTNFSKYKLYHSMAKYNVNKDYAECIYNYLVYGFHPGSFFTSLLANDFMGAVSHSHPGNTVSALKNLVTWITNVLPEGVTHGSYRAVDGWIELTGEQRRFILEQHGLIYSEQDEILKVLKGETPIEPFFMN
jgi:hypothetical protein